MKVTYQDLICNSFRLLTCGSLPPPERYKILNCRPHAVTLQCYLSADFRPLKRNHRLLAKPFIANGLLHKQEDRHVWATTTGPGPPETAQRGQRKFRICCGFSSFAFSSPSAPKCELSKDAAACVSLFIWFFFLRIVLFTVWDDPFQN